MNALQELPEKDKDLMLPLFQLRGWVGSHRLENTITRIKKSIGNRKWVADIDKSFLDNPNFLRTGEYPREVFREIEMLLKPDNGYENWYQYLKEIPEAIPTLQLDTVNELENQLDKMVSLKRGIVVKFDQADIESGKCYSVIDFLHSRDLKNLLVVFDYGQLDSGILTFVKKIAELIRYSALQLPTAIISTTGSSFPFEFAGFENGEKPIYERLLFNKVKSLLAGVNLLYSDRGSARAVRIKGGGGVPAPRIDYPLDHDWRFVRQNYDDPSNIKDGEKNEIYTEIAKRILSANYWEPNLHLWGTQLIAVTAKGDKYGIDSPSKATAVRINIHLHRQLHYGKNLEAIDTDDDWED